MKTKLLYLLISLLIFTFLSHCHSRDKFLGDWNSCNSSFQIGSISIDKFGDVYQVNAIASNVQMYHQKTDDVIVGDNGTEIRFDKATNHLFMSHSGSPTCELCKQESTTSSGTSNTNNCSQFAGKWQSQKDPNMEGMPGNGDSYTIKDNSIKSFDGVALGITYINVTCNSETMTGVNQEGVKVIFTIHNAGGSIYLTTSINGEKKYSKQ